MGICLIKMAQVSTQYASSSKHIGQVAAVMDLLDEYWFFHSTLFTTKQPPPNSVDASPSPSLEKTTKQRDSDSAMASSFLNLPSASSTPDQLEIPSSQQHKSETTTASLLISWMPTLQVPRLREDPTALPPFNSCYTKLRHSMSALDTYQSTTSPSSSSSSSSSSSKKYTCTNLSSGAGDRPPRQMIELEKTDDRYSTIRHFVAAREAYYRKTFNEKKWRSLGDLEYIEIQGLKDLGFVLDKEHLSQMHARSFTRSRSTVPVILNSQTTACVRDHDAKVVMRPYLSPQRRAPPVFRWVNRKSADDMKDQLRFWAKAVASNTKLEGF